MKFSTTFDMDDLFITQEGLRNCDQLDKMIEWVRNGGFWTKDVLLAWNKAHEGRSSHLIQVSRFEDGTEYLHDGHHRAVATWLGGRHYLRPDEYQSTDWLYSDYIEANLKNGWFTPFNPCKEVRVPNFCGFKTQAQALLSEGEDKSLDFIRANKSLYAAPRTMLRIRELAATVSAACRI